MPELKQPNLEQLYHEAGLRTSKTRNPHDGTSVTFVDPFYSFADFKRELQAILIVPLIAGNEALKQALQAFAELLIAGVRLATLDSRGFNNLGRYFVHVGNAIALAFEGTIDTIASAISLYFRTCGTMGEAMAYTLFASFDAVGSLFDYEEPVEFNTTRNTSSYAYAAPSALNREEVFPSAPPAHGNIYPSLATIQQSSANRYAFYQSAPVARPSLLQAKADLDAIEGLSEEQRTQMFQEYAVSGDYTDDRTYSGHYHSV